MNIYIEMEIKSRELQRAVLLGMAAAYRGHRVLAGKLKGRLANDHYRLPPGVYHDKDLMVRDPHKGRAAKLRTRGFKITAQDEEHGLLSSTYDQFAATRFTEASFDVVDRYVCWGDFDAAALRQRYPSSHTKLLVAGSPRVDFWRPDFARYFDSPQSLPAQDPARRILIVSNLVGPLSPNPLWLTLQTSQRYNMGAQSESISRRFFEHQLDRLALVQEYASAVERLAHDYPETEVVVRPHPVEAWGAWRPFLADLPNLTVTRQGPLGSWIRNSDVVVQNACTSGFEALITGTPMVAYCPQGIGADKLPNTLAPQADTTAALSAAVGDAFHRPGKFERKQSQQWPEAILQRFASLEGAWATDQIVDAWESLDSGNLSEPWSLRQLKTRDRARQLRRRAFDTAQRVRKHPSGEDRPADSHGETPNQQFVYQQKFSDITQSELEEIRQGIARVRPELAAVRLSFVGPQLFTFQHGPSRS